MNEAIGNRRYAFIAAGAFRDQQAVRLDSVLLATWFAGDHVTLPGRLYPGMLELQRLGSLPEDYALKAICLAGTGLVAVRDDEAASLRGFIEGGGFVIIDGDEAFRTSVREALQADGWDVEVRPLPADHALLISPNAITPPLLRGLYRGDELVGAISETDLSADWTDTRSRSSAEWQQGINAVVFAATR